MLINTLTYLFDVQIKKLKKTRVLLLEVNGQNGVFCSSVRHAKRFEVEDEL